VNEPKAKYRYWITFLLKDLQPGDNFKPGVLHMTIIPWFVTERDDKEIIGEFEIAFAAESAFETTVGKVTDFKHKRRISVNLVQSTLQILELHTKALGLFEQLEGRWAVREPHVGKDYIPHIRRRPGRGFKPGDELKVSAIYLIRAARTEDGQRTVAAKLSLG
jgi:hypothetical protein